MMDRVGYAAKNLKFTAVSELVLAVLKLVFRRIFVLSLGKEYLGISGLFTDILSMLSLAEMGFGISITYSLYRPVAQGNTEAVKSLMRLYRQVYQIIGVTVLSAGLMLTPFLNFFVKEMPESIPNIPLIYMLNVLNTGISYFFTYKSTLLFVHQKKYIEAIIHTSVTLTATIAQIAVLMLTRNYLYYLILTIGASFIQNAMVSIKTDQLFPCLREKDVRPLPEETVREIRRNVSAMILHRVGAVAVFGTDNILISKFAGVASAGLYSNYIMIRNFLNTMVHTLFNVITPALGNLNATEAEEHKREAFGRLNFFSAWLFGWMSICLLWLYDPFIYVWLGGGYLLPRPVVIMIVINFYINSMRIPVANTKSVMGLFWDERYKSIMEALMNLAVSVFLAQKWGILGILVGTFISTMALPFWIEPLGLYRHGLKRSVRAYFTDYLFRLSVTVAAGAVTGILCRMAGGTAVGFGIKILLCITVPNIVYLAAYCRTPEFQFFKNMVRSITGAHGTRWF